MFAAIGLLFVVLIKKKKLKLFDNFTGILLEKLFTWKTRALSFTLLLHRELEWNDMSQLKLYCSFNIYICKEFRFIFHRNMSSVVARFGNLLRSPSKVVPQRNRLEWQTFWWREIRSFRNPHHHHYNLVFITNPHSHHRLMKRRNVEMDWLLIDGPFTGAFYVTHD